MFILITALSLKKKFPRTNKNCWNSQANWKGWNISPSVQSFAAANIISVGFMLWCHHANICLYCELGQWSNGHSYPHVKMGIQRVHCKKQERHMVQFNAMYYSIKRNQQWLHITNQSSKQTCNSQIPHARTCMLALLTLYTLHYVHCYTYVLLKIKNNKNVIIIVITKIIPCKQKVISMILKYIISRIWHALGSRDKEDLGFDPAHEGTTRNILGYPWDYLGSGTRSGITSVSPGENQGHSGISWTSWDILDILGCPGGSGINILGCPTLSHFLTTWTLGGNPRYLCSML